MMTYPKKISDAVFEMIENVAGDKEVKFERMYPVTKHCVVIRIGDEKVKIKLEKCDKMVTDEVEEERYYIQDTRNYLGNAMMWWGPNNGGYTADISKAGKYTLEEAKRHHASRSTDVAWACGYIDAKKVSVIDAQYVSRKGEVEYLIDIHN